jgi:prepilin-type N-terminal cleavage/methylation domain-containing protein
MRSHSRRGFTLAEILLTLFLLSVFALVASEVFGSVFGAFREGEKAQSQTSAYSEATAQLRKDVWGASGIGVVDAVHVRLAHHEGDQINWTIDPDGNLVRAANANPPTHWATGMKLSFEKDQAALVLSDPATDRALGARFLSQVLIGGGSQ